jgi:hypothetical protein
MARRPVLIAEAVARLRDVSPHARRAAAHELMRLEADRPAFLAALVKAVETGDMPAREGLTLALERAQPDPDGRRPAAPTVLTLANADREPDPAARACLRAARKAIAAVPPTTQAAQ